MINQGWIKLYRQLLDDTVWKRSSSVQKNIFITILLLANHSENEWDWNGKKFKVQAGQLVTSRDSLAEKAGCTPQNVRTALKRFEKLEILTIKSTKTGTLITINNWEKYQSADENTNQDSNQHLTNAQPTPNQHLTTNKNDKNDKNDENVFFNSQAEPDRKKAQLNDYFQKEIWSIYPESRRGNYQAAFNEFLNATKEDSTLIIASGIKKYVANKATEPIKYTAMLANNLKRKDYRNDYGINKPHHQPKLPYWERPDYQPQQYSDAELAAMEKKNQELMKKMGLTKERKEQ